MESTIKELHELGQDLLKEVKQLREHKQAAAAQTMVITPQPHRPHGDQGPLEFFAKSPPPLVVPWAPKWHPQAPLPQAPGGPPCAWHGKGNAPPAGSFIGTRADDLDPWFNHLTDTLGYDLKDPSILHKAYFFFRKNWKSLIVTACPTQANRGFHIECIHCSHACAAKYGHSNTPDKEAAMIAANEALGQFSLVPSDPEKREE